MTDLEKIDAPPELRETVAACVKWSMENTIATTEDYEATAGHLQEIKAQLKAADAFFDGPIFRQELLPLEQQHAREQPKPGGES